MRSRKVGLVNWEERVLETILDHAIDRLREGETVEELLTAYPEQSQALQPLLTTASLLMQIEPAQPRPQAYWRGKARLEEALCRQQVVANNGESKCA